MLEPAPRSAAAVERVAIVLAIGLTPAESANVSACIAAGLATSSGPWAGRPLRDVDGLDSCSSSHLPIAVLAATPSQLGALIERFRGRARPEGATATIFPAYAKAMHDVVRYWACHATTSHQGESLLGLGVAGPRKWVNSLVGSLPLLR